MPSPPLALSSSGPGPAWPAWAVGRGLAETQAPTVAGHIQHAHVPHPDCQVNQGNMPGVQSTFLAMDTEEGVEVVWNELHFSDRKAFSAHEVRRAAPPPPRLP